MKYALVAGLVTVAAASPQWESWSSTTEKKPEPTKDVDWEEWHKHPSYTTTVVTAITTYCSEPTKIVHAGKTWDVTKATTLTITDCPCTISVPVYTKTSSSCAPKATDNDDWSVWPNGCKYGKDKDGKDCKFDENDWSNYPLGCKNGKDKDGKDCKANNNGDNKDDDWANYPLGCKNGKDKYGKDCNVNGDNKDNKDNKDDEWSSWPNGCKYGKTKDGKDCKFDENDWSNYPLGCKNGKDKDGKDCKVAASSTTAEAAWSTWANVPVAASSTSSADDWANYPLGCKNGKDKYGKDCNADAASTWANYPVADTTASVPAGSATSTWAAWASGASASSTGPVVAKWTGAASKVNVGAGLAGVAGLAALLL